MLYHWIVAAALTLTTLARAGDGDDMPGADYQSFPASTPFVCRDSCGGDTRCQAWVWVKPGVQGPHAQCWLKDRVPASVKNGCCSSGPRRAISASHLKAEDRTDRPGGDYRDFVSDSAAACETTCQDEARCTAWTYARPGLQGPRGHCWLKTKVPHPVDNLQTVSGVKYKSIPGKFD